MDAAEFGENLINFESVWLQKVKEFLTSSSLTSKLQAKHDLLQDAIQKGAPRMSGGGWSGFLLMMPSIKLFIKKHNTDSQTGFVSMIHILLFFSFLQLRPSTATRPGKESI